jgi:multidrug efflux pump subunit AcrB
MNSIESLAHALATAEADRDATRAELIELESSLAEVVGRLTALDVERQKILESRPVDAAGLLTINAADMESLQPIQEQRQAAASAQHDLLVQADRDVSFAKSQLARAADREYLDRLVIHAGDIDRLMMATLAEIGRLSVGGRPVWAPSPALADAIRRADLQRAGVR